MKIVASGLEKFVNSLTSAQQAFLARMIEYYVSEDRPANLLLIHDLIVHRLHEKTEAETLLLASELMELFSDSVETR